MGSIGGPRTARTGRRRPRGPTPQTRIRPRMVADTLLESSMQNRPRIARPTRLVALAAIAASACLGGCLYSSYDSHPYVSRTWSPKTVTLVDSRTGEELWRYDLAVGNKMRIRFFSGDEDNLIMPDEMRWEVKNVESGKVIDSDEMPCPPEGVRRIDWHERPAPEYPKLDAPRGEPAPLPEPAQETLEAPEGDGEG